MISKLCQAFLLMLSAYCFSQNYWQQAVDYKMVVDMNVDNFTYSGEQQLIYTNNSPDVLNKVFYHLYFNAFKPGSEMAARIKNGRDQNTRFDIDIDTIDYKQQGYLKVYDLMQNDKNVKSKLSGTILEVTLNEPIKPGNSTTLSLKFEGKVPGLIRRAGKNSPEGVALSMAQWYPKMAEYDYDGWMTMMDGCL